MKRKNYYNLTQIKNGWLMSYPKYMPETDMLMGTEEMFFQDIEDVVEQILGWEVRQSPTRVNL